MKSATRLVDTTYDDSQKNLLQNLTRLNKDMAALNSKKIPLNAEHLQTLENAVLFYANLFHTKFSETCGKLNAQNMLMEDSNPILSLKDPRIEEAKQILDSLKTLQSELLNPTNNPSGYIPSQLNARIQFLEYKLECHNKLIPYMDEKILDSKGTFKKKGAAISKLNNAKEAIIFIGSAQDIDSIKTALETLRDAKPSSNTLQKNVLYGNEGLLTRADKLLEEPGKTPRPSTPTRSGND